MRFFIYFLLSVMLVLFLGGSSSHAQIVPLMLKGRTAVVPGGYTGPGDLQSWIIAGGCSMAYSAATRGQAVCTICDAAENCTNMATDATTGIGIVPSPAGSICNDSTNICDVKVMFDKSGNANDWSVPGGVKSRRPKLRVACGFSNGAPCFYYDGSSDLNYLQSANVPLGSPTSWSALAIAQRTGNFTTQGMFLSNSPGSLIVLGFDSVINQFQINAQFNATTTEADSAWHTFQAADAISTFAVDATQTVSGFGSNGWDNSVKVGSICGFCNGSLTGYVAFVGVSASTFSGSDMTTMNTTVHTILGY